MVKCGVEWMCVFSKVLNVDVDAEIIKDASALSISQDQDRASWVSYGYQYGFNASFQMFTLRMHFTHSNICTSTYCIIDLPLALRCYMSTMGT